LNRLARALLLMFIAVGVLTFACVAHFGTAQASTEVYGLITSDTTWTKANSPYNLTSSITVASEATLTIEPGTIVQLNEYHLQINGTLIARGTSSDPINFHGGTPISTGGWKITTGDNAYSIVFSPSSANWSQQAQSGCIIENAVIGNLVINGGSPKISNSFLGNIDMWGGTPEISNNTVVGGIGVYAGSALIANNTVSQQYHYFLGYGGAIVAQRYDRNNNAGFYEGTGNALILGNTIYDCSYGINLNETGRLHGDHNAVITIQRNLICNTTLGIDSTLPVTIENNTIKNNAVGIATSAPLSIIYNNIEGNNQSIYLASSNNLNATNNWWGTTDTPAINQTIHDNKNDANLGTVTFVPFLTEPNPEVCPASTPGIPELPLSLTLALLITVTLAVAVGFKRKAHSKRSLQPCFSRTP